MKLYEIPNDSKMRIEFIEEGKSIMRDCTFVHLGGMYSLCTIDDIKSQDPKERVTFHLSASTPMKLVDKHYEIDDNPPKEESENPR